MAKVRIPKRVGGIEIPKKVRKRAKKVVKMAESDSFRAFAQAAAATAARGQRAAREASAEAREDARQFGARISIDAEHLGETLRAAAIDGLRRFLEGLEEGLQRTNVTVDAAPVATPAAPKKKQKPRKPSGPAGVAT
ncbi:MAG: hypothetical protein KF780_05305 [Sphingomonas sp.]|nr:hypothetical protein [Sphingomonas sp.]